MAATDVLDLFGTEWMYDRILDLRSLTEIAQEADVALSTLSRWVASDLERSARVREARRLAAEAWVEKAEQVVADAKNGFELQRARELAHHYRWKASKINPQFNDRVVQDHTSSDGSMTPKAAATITTSDPQEAAKLYAEMMGK